MATERPSLVCTRDRFRIPRDVAYLNCAYMSPLSTAVVEAGQRGLLGKTHPWELSPGDFFEPSELARRRYGEVIGADAEHIALTPSASYGLAVAAQNVVVERGQTIVVLAEQFPSNVYPWMERCKEVGAELVTVQRPSDDDWTSAVLSAISSRTALAALPHCHWADGGLLDLSAIGAALRERGAALVVDATQSLGAMPFSVQEVQPDFLVAAAYKWLMGPYSQAFVYVAKDRSEGRPLEQNWISRACSEDFAGLVRYRSEFQPGARRFDVGERSNFILVPMVVQALAEVLEADISKTYTLLSARTNWMAERALELGIASVPADRRAGHYLGLRFRGGVPTKLVEQLAAAKVYVSVRGGCMRVTPHLYNDDEDIDRFLGLLASSVRS